MQPKISIAPVRKSNAPTNPYAEVLARPRSEVANVDRQTTTQDKSAKPAASGGENRRGNGKGNVRGNSRGNESANRRGME